MAESDADALFLAARRAYDANDWNTLERVARELIDLGRRTGEKRTQARALQNLGIALYHRSETDDARAAYEKSLELFREIDDRFAAAVVHMSLASVALDLRNDAIEARRRYTLALPVIRESGNVERLAQALGNLAEIARLEGDYDEAIAYAREALPLFEQIGDTNRVGWQHITIAQIHALRREYRSAIDELNVSFDALLRSQNPRWLATYFDVWFMLAVQLRQWELAAQLMGFLERYRDQHRLPRLAGQMSWYSVSVEQIARRLSAKLLRELRDAGAALTVDRAQELTRAINAVR
jgi:tetratricopeptide (TPR) repeat protein